MQEGCQTFTGFHLCVVDKVENTDDTLKKIVQALEVDGHAFASELAIWSDLPGSVAAEH